MKSEKKHAERLAAEVGARASQVAAAIRLLDEGATVPFVARYRKEATGGLDDQQLRQLHAGLFRLRDLDARRERILLAVKEQGKLTDGLHKAFMAAGCRTQLEDLYAPYKRSRRTRAQAAREAGLAPLAAHLCQGGDLAEAVHFVAPDAGIDNVDDALAGAGDILIEQLAEQPALHNELRLKGWAEGRLTSVLVKNRQSDAEKFRDYFDYDEALSRVPSHRALAVMRGQREGMLRVSVGLDEAAFCALLRCHAPFQFSTGSREWLLDILLRGWRERFRPTLEKQLLSRLKEAADDEAIRVFGRNLQDLLLAAPAGQRVTLALDPGLRTGVKLAVVDATGKLLATDTLYPHPPRNDWQGALRKLADYCRRYSVELVAIGNGTASRETDKLVSELLPLLAECQLQKVMVSEAGASVYSASELAAAEFPDLDVSLRGAVSIARRLQDPLAELVKIDPAAIGVGQYQHDVDQRALMQRLDGVVEDCVNAVGVELNSASEALLQRVAGIGPVLAANIVTWREKEGAFRNRRQLLKVPRLGARAYEQCAGFLRVRQSDQPLDCTGVHPESYPLVAQLADMEGVPVTQLVGRGMSSPLELVCDLLPQAGRATLQDILVELKRPGRDPRPEFQRVRFNDAVTSLTDLHVGMRLEGVVTNVANFGAFVDVGVHQDGLVHISQLAERFVKDPHEVVKPGQIVQVRVVDVDVARRRIALSMRAASPEETSKTKEVVKSSTRSGSRQGCQSTIHSKRVAPSAGGALADAFKRARQR